MLLILSNNRPGYRESSLASAAFQPVSSRSSIFRSAAKSLNSVHKPHDGPMMFSWCFSWFASCSNRCCFSVFSFFLGHLNDMVDKVACVVPRRSVVGPLLLSLRTLPWGHTFQETQRKLAWLHRRRGALRILLPLSQRHLLGHLAPADSFLPPEWDEHLERLRSVATPTTCWNTLPEPLDLARHYRYSKAGLNHSGFHLYLITLSFLFNLCFSPSLYILCMFLGAVCMHSCVSVLLYTCASAFKVVFSSLCGTLYFMLNELCYIHRFCKLAKAKFINICAKRCFVLSSDPHLSEWTTLRAGSHPRPRAAVPNLQPEESEVAFLEGPGKMRNSYISPWFHLKKVIIIRESFRAGTMTGLFPNVSSRLGYVPV